jgi:hypothetical protein
VPAYRSSADTSPCGPLSGPRCSLELCPEEASDADTRVTTIPYRSAIRRLGCRFPDQNPATRLEPRHTLRWLATSDVAARVAASHRRRSQSGSSTRSSSSRHWCPGGAGPLHHLAAYTPKAPEVMKAPPQDCYNCVIPGRGYDKRDEPWTRALVDWARRGTTWCTAGFAPLRSGGSRALSCSCNRQRLHVPRSQEVWYASLVARPLFTRPYTRRRPPAEQED